VPKVSGALWLSFASPHCQALWTCSRLRKACYQHDTEHTDRSAQQTAACLHTSTWHTYMPIHTHTTGTYAHMHVHITHAQTCLHVHRANLCSSLRLEGSAARLHTCMYLLTYKHACTDNTQSCSQGEFMVIFDGVSQEGQARQGAHHPGRH